MAKEGFLREIHITELCTAIYVGLCVWLIVKISKKQCVLKERTDSESSASGGLPDVHFK